MSKRKVVLNPVEKLPRGAPVKPVVKFDSRPRRARTRGAARDRAIREF